MPIYRNKETGKQVEVMPGTRLPKIYEEVKNNTTAQPKTQQQAGTQDTTANTEKPAAKKGGKGKGKSKSATISKNDNTQNADDTVKE